MDVESGRVLYEQNSKKLPGEHNKILTAIVALEHGNLSDLVTATQASGIEALHLVETGEIHT